jgi:hypothetical protein
VGRLMDEEMHFIYTRNLTHPTDPGQSRGEA